MCFQAKNSKDRKGYILSEDDLTPILVTPVLTCEEKFLTSFKLL